MHLFLLSAQIVVRGVDETSSRLTIAAAETNKIDKMGMVRIGNIVYLWEVRCSHLLSLLHFISAPLGMDGFFRRTPFVRYRQEAVVSVNHKSSCDVGEHHDVRVPRSNVSHVKLWKG